MKITFYGHASLGIQIKDIYILVDPFITANEKASAIDIIDFKSRLYLSNTCTSRSYFRC